MKKYGFSKKRLALVVILAFVMSIFATAILAEDDGSLESSSSSESSDSGDDSSSSSSSSSYDDSPDINDDAGDDSGDDINDDLGDDSPDTNDDVNDDLNDDLNDDINDDLNDDLGDDSPDLNDDAGDDLNDDLGDDSPDGILDDSNSFTVQAQQTTITGPDEAGSIALAVAPGTIKKVEQDVEDDNLVWKVKIRTLDGGKAELIIDAGTKQVIRSDIEPYVEMNLFERFLSRFGFV